MSTITKWGTGEVIKIDFPQAKFDEYLRKAGHSDNKPLFPHFTRLIFKMAYNDFMSRSLSLDDFSAIGDYLWNHEGRRDDELSNILLFTGELNYYVRQIRTNNQGNFAKFLAEICEYGEKLNQELP